jgi:ABC-2 type transport system permease protein
MKRALRAEWTKLRTDPGNIWLLIGTVALTVAIGASVASTTRCPSAGCGQDAARISLTGIMAGQVVIAIVAVLAVGTEYGTGMIRTTFTALPRRTEVLAAKAAVLAGVTLVAGTVSVLGSVLAGRLLLPGNGFTARNGYAALLSLGSGPVLRATAGSVLYLMLIALLGLGIVTAVRNSAVAIGIVLALLFVFPVVARVVPDPAWQRHLDQIAPMPAGLAIQATLAVSKLPIGPWPGIGVVALWAAAALLGGGMLLRLRDA